MAAARTAATILNAVTTTTTGTAATVSTGYGGTIGVTITQVGTPTTPSSFVVTWTTTGGLATYQIPASGSFQGPSVAGTITPTISIPIGAATVNVVFTAATGGTSSTCSAEAGWVTTT